MPSQKSQILSQALPDHVQSHPALTAMDQWRFWLPGRDLIDFYFFLIDVAMAGKSFALLETTQLQVKTATVCGKLN